MSQEIKLSLGDITIQNGKIQLLENEDKLIQQVSKTVITQKGGKFNPDYGSNIINLIGRYSAGNEFLLPLIRKEIEDALSYYQSIQIKQENIQSMSDEEVAVRIENINLQNVNNVGFVVNGNIKNRSSDNVNFTIS